MNIKSFVVGLIIGAALGIGIFSLLQNINSSGSESKVKNNENTQYYSTTFDDNEVVYITPNGKKYHRQNCIYLRGNGIAINILEARRKGLQPCKRCFGSR